MILLYLITDYLNGIIHINPEVLPNAVLNHPYSTNITIDASVIEGSFHSEISNNNFKLIPEQRIDGNDIYGNPNIYYNYENRQLVGTSRDTQPIRITLQGTSYGSMFFSNKDFKKEYILEVKEK